jgi:hypothetical protein
MIVSKIFKLTTLKKAVTKLGLLRDFIVYENL